MQWQCQVREDAPVMHIRLEGLVTVDVLRAMIPRALEVAAGARVLRFIVDYRDAQLGIDTFDIYTLPRINRNFGVDARYRVALLYRVPRQATDGVQFAAHVARAAGLTQRAFVNESDALAWVASDEPAE